MNKNFNNKKEKGFVILFAVLISSVVLLIALGIANIASNENILSSSAREAQNAFFAADTGAECALYWDKATNGLFNDPLLFPYAGPTPFCGGAKVGLNGSFPHQWFSMDINGGLQSVAVDIDKDYPTGTGGTKIESRGYNVSLTQIGSNPKAIERAVRLTY